MGATEDEPFEIVPRGTIVEMGRMVVHKPELFHVEHSWEKT
jgi:hypothetical protein